MRTSNNIELSIVTTIYNDAPLVKELVGEIQDQCIQLKVDYEIILVNDSSTDNSEEEIQRVCRQYKNVQGIALLQNCIQVIAISLSGKEDVLWLG